MPAARLEPALELLAEVAPDPTFPDAEVERLRDERLNDLLQAEADPRRRADEAFAATIYSAGSPYRRPSGGTRRPSRASTRRALRAAYAARPRSRAGPPSSSAATSTGSTSAAIAERLLGGWGAPFGAGSRGTIVAESAVRERFVRVLHRPGSVQTEIRIGHVGVPRRIPDFHALSVMGAILGGLFNSRLNMKLREEKGYTYGAGAGFDMRRGAGPVRRPRRRQHRGHRPGHPRHRWPSSSGSATAPVTDDELRAARDFLDRRVPAPVRDAGADRRGARRAGGPRPAATTSSLATGPASKAVTIEDVQTAAATHVRPDAAAIVLVGDVDAFGTELEAAGLGPIVVEGDRGPKDEGRDEGVQEGLGPVDEGSSGPTEGGEDPDPTDAGEAPTA